MPSVIIDEFLLALDQEIAAVKKGKGGSALKVLNGRFLREISGFYVYVFSLENFLAAVDDSPAEIEIDGKRCAGQVLLTRGLEVEICIERFFGESVPEARLQTNQWYLLESLKKKFSELRDGGGYEVSEALFSGKTDVIPGLENIIQCGGCRKRYRIKKYSAEKNPFCRGCRQEIKPQYSLSGEPPNQAQEKAISGSFFSDMAVIWGPPGTGKTRTIAQAVEAHLSAGRRVLLVSHANAAVDEALEDVAEQLKHTEFYNEGRLVRLGMPQSTHFEKLNENYPLVLLDNISSKLGESLSKEEQNLKEKKRGLEDILESYGSILEAVNTAKKLKSDLSSFESEISNLSGRLKTASEELLALERLQEENKDKLSESRQAGALKKMFKGSSPARLQQLIDKASVSIDGKRRLAKEIRERLKEVQDLYGKKEAGFEEAKKTAQNLLNETNVPYAEIVGKSSEISEEKELISDRIREISGQLEDMQSRILSEARLIATTLTKTFSARQFPKTKFDALILDEVSMAPLPALYWAAGRCGGSLTFVGDFLQLPPICISDGEMAKKWLGRSLFEVLGIDNVENAARNERVMLLDTQYRMSPDISVIPNKIFYQNMLKDGPCTKDYFLDDGVSKFPLVLVETKQMNPWCSRISTGGRFNLYNAVLCAALARKIINNGTDCTIGIITPYKAQGRLINKIAKDWGIFDRVHTSTVHSFQGGEEPVIIFDTVEGPGSKVAPMLDDTKPDSDARLLLNVALTRAKYRVYLIAHTKHLFSNLHRDSALSGIVNHFRKHAQEIPSESLVDSYFTGDFEKWAGSQLTVAESPAENYGRMYTEKNFWAEFFRDVRGCEKRLLILSPFLTVKRAGRFIDFFRALKSRGADIRIYTRPRNQQTGEMANQSGIIIDQLRGIGVNVLELRNMHQKVAIIDDVTAWEGSLNILSHKDTKEHMRRFEGSAAVEEIIKNLDLYGEMPAGSQIEKQCPEPGCGGSLVVRTKHGRKFLGCTNYSKKKCRYTKPL